MIGRRPVRPAISSVAAPALGEARGAGQLGLDHQTMAVLHQEMTMKHSRASLPSPLRNRRASGSVVEVSLIPRSPWKSRRAWRGRGGAGPRRASLPTSPASNRSVGREGGRVPDRIIDPKPDEPAEQQVVVAKEIVLDLDRDG